MAALCSISKNIIFIKKILFAVKFLKIFNYKNDLNRLWIKISAKK